MNSSDFKYPNLRIWTLAVDSMDEMLFLVDEDGKVLAANRAVGRWGVCEVENAVNQPFHKVVHRSCGDKNCYLKVFWKRFKRLAEKQSKVEQENEDRYLGKGLYLCFELLKPVRKAFIEKSKQPFAMLAFRDVTALRRRQEVERRQMLFETFHFVLRSLYHEIGNPLAAMRTTVEVLQGNLDAFPREKAREYLRRVIEGTERLQTILERADRDTFFPKITLAPVSLKHLFRRMYRLFEDEFKAWGIHFEVVLPIKGKDPQLLLDLTAIEEVIVNFIKNAREASKPGDRGKAIPSIKSISCAFGYPGYG